MGAKVNRGNQSLAAAAIGGAILGGYCAGGPGLMSGIVVGPAWIVVARVLLEYYSLGKEIVVKAINHAFGSLVVAGIGGLVLHDALGGGPAAAAFSVVVAGAVWVALLRILLSFAGIGMTLIGKSLKGVAVSFVVALGAWGILVGIFASSAAK